MNSHRAILAVGAVLALLAGCSDSPDHDPATPTSKDQPSEDLFVDERLEAEPFARSEKVDICSQVADVAESSEVLDGTPHLDVVEEEEWFCRIDGVDWITIPAAATIELAFYEYTDEELQNLRDEVAKARLPYSACGLVTFYEDDVDISEVGGAIDYCEQQTGVTDTSYLVRNGTVITVRLQLEGSPEEHTMYNLQDDPFSLRTEIIELLDQYTP